MNADTWNEVDEYIVDLLIEQDDALKAALQRSEREGLPSHSVSASQGKLLQLLARLHSARNILEIGTLGGYSTIWLARSLPKDGHLVTLEANPKHAEVAQSNIADAGLADVVDVKVGAALETLPLVLAEKREPFDLVFIDANKEDNAEYFEWALKLCRPGALIIVDNVIRDGAVLDANSTDPRVQGVRRLNERLAVERSVSVTEIQTVGSKGYDGFAFILVEPDKNSGLSSDA